MEFQNCVFKDQATGAAVLTAQLPPSFTCQAKVETFQNPGGAPGLRFQAAAFDTPNHIELYIQQGENYTATHPQQGGPSDSVYHPYCEAAYQLDELSAQFIGQPVPSVNKFYLPEGRMAELQRDGSQKINQMYNISCQVAQMGQIKPNVQLAGTILDGAMGIYPFMNNNAKKTLYSALWRIGLSIAIGVPGIFSQAPTVTTWSIPINLYMITDGDPSGDHMAIFSTFVNTLKDAPEFRSYVDQINNAATNHSLNAAQRSAQENAAMWSQAFAQQEAAWARTRAMSQSLSQNLDQFRAGLAESSASMDAFHNTLHSANQSDSFSSSFGSDESSDDRIQRQRHEATMGVNTYVREDGTEYEHTIMDNRVFENNLDQTQHFGTENYFGDYVPDGWHELNRK